jgi:uncharacterized protein (TIGR00266 family)
MVQCPRCRSEMTFIAQYNQNYCYACQLYESQMASQAPPVPAQPPATVQAPAPASPGQQAFGQQPQYPVPPGFQQAPAGPQYEIVHNPAFSALILKLRQNEAVTAEKNAMMYMQPTIDIATHGREGGLLKGLVTSALGSESFFVNTFTATRGPGELALVGPLMGDIRAVPLYAVGLVIQSGDYLASTPGIMLDTKWQGLKGFFAERDMVMLHATGQGVVFISSFGGVIEKDLAYGEMLTIDTGHMVAFSDTMNYSLRRVGGWKSTILSGEGLVVDIGGPGKVLMQTRQLPVFASEILRFMPAQR